MLLTTEEPDAMLRALFAKIRSHMGLDICLNYMVNDDPDRRRLESYFGLSEEAARSMARSEFGQAVSRRVALERKPVVVAQVGQSDDPSFDLLKSLGFQSYVCYPLVAEGRLFGTLSFASRTRDRFGDDELEFLRTLTHYMTVAYERLRLVKELRESDRKRMTFIAAPGPRAQEPARPIRNGLQLMRLAGDDSIAVAQARLMMDRQLGHMVRLIDDLLDVSRISRNMIELRRSRVHLAAVIESAAETAGPEH